MKTQAAILVETGRPLVLAELEIPILKPGQALVEIAYSGACGTQVLEVRGHRGEDRWLPHCLGHEGTGRVIEVGGAVSKVKAGDAVVLSWLKGDGLDEGGATYDWNGTTVNAGGVTTFQRHAVVSENRLTPLPEGLAMDVAVLLGCAALTGMGAVHNVVRLEAGQSVAIFGTGGIGLNACMAAASCRAAPIIGIDRNPARRDLARRYGATHVIDPSSTEVAEEILRIAPGGVDAAIEATGHPEVMAQAVAATRPRGGIAVVIGNAPTGSKLVLDPAVFNQGKSLLGTWGGGSFPDRDVASYARLLSSGRFPVRDLLSAPYRLDQADRALDDLEAGRVGRPLIDVAL